MPTRNPFAGSILASGAPSTSFAPKPPPAAAGAAPIASPSPSGGPGSRPFENPTMPGGTPNPARPPIYVPPTALPISPEQMKPRPGGGEAYGPGGAPTPQPAGGVPTSMPLGDPLGPMTVDPITGMATEKPPLGGAIPIEGGDQPLPTLGGEPKPLPRPGGGEAFDEYGRPITPKTLPTNPADNGTPPVEPTGPPTADDLSGDIDTSIDDMINNGTTPFGGQIAATLADIIARGGRTPQTERQLLGARENSARQMQALMADARGELASRGLADQPGVDQGAETLALSNITEKVGRDQAAALRDITTHAVEMSNDDVMKALELSTGMSRDQSTAILGAIGQGTSRQIALANIALDQLQQDQDWSKFLAQHGLDVEKVRAQIDQGEIANVIALLQLYLQGGEIAAGGFI